MFGGASNLIFEHAKRLRQNLTIAELVLWGYLKQKRGGHKLRRQHPFGIYIADFYCHSLKLVVEVDGDIHTQDDVIRNDSIRQLILENEGLKVIRFTNEEVEKNLSHVITIIGNYIIHKASV